MTTSYAQKLPPEILSRVFEFSEFDSNARCARVCKAWTESALDELWRELGDWTEILASLADTVEDPVTQKTVRLVQQFSADFQGILDIYYAEFFVSADQENLGQFPQ